MADLEKQNGVETVIKQDKTLINKIENDENPKDKSDKIGVENQDIDKEKKHIDNNEKIFKGNESGGNENEYITKELNREKGDNNKVAEKETDEKQDHNEKNDDQKINGKEKQSDGKIIETADEKNDTTMINKKDESIENKISEEKNKILEGETSTEKNQNDSEEDSLENKLAYSKELFNNGSRNFLLKNYQTAADELGEACKLYDEIYGAESTELGMPLLLYAKSLIALSLDENKVLDVPDVEEEDDSDDQPEEEVSEEKISKENGVSKVNGEASEVPIASLSPNAEKLKEQPGTSTKSVASSSFQEVNGGTKNGTDDEEEDSDATNLQIAWETLELAAKIFAKQGSSGLHNLSEIHTELGNIQFENEIFDAAREDYDKALVIYDQLTVPVKGHRRIKAEIHYKIGLTLLLQTMNQKAAESFKTACNLLDDEVEEIKHKNQNNMDDNVEKIIKDIEETQQDIMAKIAEIEETRQQVLDEVRAVLDKFKSPSKHNTENNAGSSSLDNSVSSSSKPHDITHLIKRKKPDVNAETEESPAKRLNTEKTE